MFRAVPCSSSGGQIVLLQPLVSSFSVNGCTVCRLTADCSPLSTKLLLSFWPMSTTFSSKFVSVYWLSMVKILWMLSTACCWVRKLSNGGGNVDVNNQACYRSNYVNRQKVNALIPLPPQKNSQTTKVEKSNIGLANINDITEDLVYNKVCTQRMLCQRMPKIRTASLEACQQLLSCYESEVTIFCTALL